MSAEALQAGLESPRQEAVVGIQEDEQVPVAPPDARVPRSGEAPVLLKDVAHAGIARDDLGRVVGRAVVYHHDLVVRIRLAEDALDRLGEEPRFAVGRDPDVDQCVHRLTTVEASAMRRRI
jgi:hypothetical protein